MEGFKKTKLLPFNLNSKEKVEGKLYSVVEQDSQGDYVPVRIICWDGDVVDGYPIVGLKYDDYDQSKPTKYPVQYDKNGVVKGAGYHLFLSDDPEPKFKPGDMVRRKGMWTEGYTIAYIKNGMYYCDGYNFKIKNQKDLEIAPDISEFRNAFMKYLNGTSVHPADAATHLLCIARDMFEKEYVGDLIDASKLTKLDYAQAIIYDRGRQAGREEGMREASEKARMEFEKRYVDGFNDGKFLSQFNLPKWKKVELNEDIHQGVFFPADTDEGRKMYTTDEPILVKRKDGVIQICSCAICPIEEEWEYVKISDLDNLLTGKIFEEEKTEND